MSQSPIIKVLLVVAFLGCFNQIAQSQQLDLDHAILLARSKSVAAVEAKNSFISTYWKYKSYIASRLPSASIYGSLMNFNRSLTLLQSYEDGSLKYANSFNLQNSAGLRVSQNLTLTGGSLTLYSDLFRIDQFGSNSSLTWYSQPVTVYYSQPLFAYNQFKWDRQIEPKEYEKGKREYIESMEEVTIKVVSAYFNLVLAYKNAEIALNNYNNAVKMCAIAGKRMEMGSVTRDEYLQLELRMLKDSISINENSVKVREAQMTLNSFLGYDEHFEVEPVFDELLPDVIMDYDFVMAKALSNSSFNLNNDIDLLNAKASVEMAKAEGGITMSLGARFGLSQTADKISNAYRNPLDQEVVGLTFSIPIIDWGLAKGKVQKAKASEEVVKAQVQEKENVFRRKLFTSVGQFNNQRQQCSISKKAMAIASERYMLAMDKFRNGKLSVTELNTAQSENDNALESYITDVCNYWIFYYTLKKLALYDFIKGEDIDIDVSEMMK